MKKYIENVISVKSQEDLDYVRSNYMVKQKILIQCNCCKKPLIKKLGKIKNKTFSELTCKQCTLENNLLDTYGVINVYQLSFVKDKIKNTFIKNIGVSHPLKLKKYQDKVKETRLKNNNGVYRTAEETQKIQKTFYEKHKAYGNFGRKSVKNKSENTQLKLYKRKCFIGTEAYYNKMLNTYGETNPDYIEEFIKIMNSKYMYENKYFDSSWELAYYIWLKDHNVRFEYHSNSISYYWLGDKKTHTYYPDFLLNGKDYVEIKNEYLLSKMLIEGTLDNAKYKKMKGLNVTIITNCDKYLDYVNKTYGTTYLRQFKIKKKVNNSIENSTDSDISCK